MIPLPQTPKITKKEKNTAIFEIEPLYPGYGVTIGNALRRVLLSSLEGAAITEMKIKGVPHEFTTIPGVLEDVITIMLNLKQLRFRMIGNEPQRAILKVKGEKEVRGKDFQLPAQLELVNPDCYLATLTSKSAQLEMEVVVEKGVGYRERGARKKGKLEIGVIPVDAIFTPVKKVVTRVENIRVGERTDFNKLSLEVETDGTISPEEAFSQACQILVDHFSLLKKEFEKKEYEEKTQGKKTK